MLSPMDFGMRLKEARRAAGVTQQQLADAIGLSNAAISKMEAGLTEAVLAPNLFAVADFLRVDARWLATGEGDPQRRQDALGQELSSLPADQQLAVRAIIQSMKK